MSPYNIDYPEIRVMNQLRHLQRISRNDRALAYSLEIQGLVELDSFDLTDSGNDMRGWLTQAGEALLESLDNGQ